MEKNVVLFTIEVKTRIIKVEVLNSYKCPLYGFEEKNLTLRLYDNYESEIITDIMLDYSPFGNCQSFSIGWINSLLNEFGEKGFVEFLIKLKNYFPKSYGYKNLLVLDIKKIDNAYDVLKRIYHNTSGIVLEAPYISTNGSNMVQFIVDVRNSTLNKLKEKYNIS